MVNEVAAVVETGDREAITRGLDTAEFWGGAGSVLDVYFGDKADDDKLVTIERDLLGEMEHLGLASPAVFLRKELLR